MPTNPIAPYAIVEAPARERSLHGLLSVVEPLTGNEDWLRGLTWDPVFCAFVASNDPATFIESHPTSLSTAVTGSGGGLQPGDDLLIVYPFMLENGVNRVTWGFLRQDYPAVPARLLEDATEFSVEREFWTGSALSTNPHLAMSSATLVNTGTALGTKRALAALEQEALEHTLGQRVMIHASAEVVTMWMGDGTLADDGGTIVTKSKGNVVVAGAGYPGTGPSGDTHETPEDGHSWAYATGMVDVRLTDVVVSPDKLAMALAPGTNEVTYRASRFAAVSFDPCSGPLAVYVNLGS